MPLGWACAGLVSLLGVATPPQAPLSVERDEATAQCPSAETLDAMVSARMGRPAFPPDAPAQVTVVLVRVEQQVVATVTLRSPQGTTLGTRRLVTRERGCTRMQEALVVTLAIALEQFSAAALPVPVEPAPLPSSQPASAPAVVPPEPPTATAAIPGRAPLPPRSPRAFRPAYGKAAKRWGVQLHAGGVAQAGALPALAPGPLVGVGLRWDRFVGGVEAWGLAPSLRARGTGAWYAGGVGLTALVCTRAGWLLGCAVAGGGGLLQGLTTGTQRGPALSPLVNLGGRLALDVPLGGPWGARPWVELTAPLVFTQTVLDQKTLWQTWRVLPSAGMAARAEW